MLKMATYYSNTMFLLISHIQLLKSMETPARVGGLNDHFMSARFCGVV